MRSAFNWIIGLVAAAVLTGGAVSLAASAMPTSEATGSTASLQAQLNDLNAKRAALDAQIAQRNSGAASTPTTSGRAATPTTSTGAQRAASQASSQRSFQASAEPTTVPPITVPPTTTPVTTPTTLPSGGGDDHGSNTGGSGEHAGDDND